MEDLWTQSIESAVQQGWAYSVWLDILNTQMKKASEFRMNFRGSIEVKTKIQKFRTDQIVVIIKINLFRMLTP